MAKRPELMIASGELTGKRFQIEGACVRLGRSSSNDIHIPDEELSRNHCMFEPDGEDGIKITDLASANGTLVNGVMLGADPYKLKPGDRIEVGATIIKVIGEEKKEEPPKPVVEPPKPAEKPVEKPVEKPIVKPAEKKSEKKGKVDLGLGKKKFSGTPAPAHKRSPVANLLWIVTALIVAGAIWVVLFAPRDNGSNAVPLEKPVPIISSLSYEKIEADATRVFRYYMTIDENGILRVIFDDVPGEDRHVDKRGRLSERALKRVREIFDTRGYAELEEAYTGSSVESENALKSWRIRTVMGEKVKDVLVENTLEPEAFKTVREALEAFSRNELGIWAVQYTREQLIELSEQSAKIGDAKFEEREVEYGNLNAAVKAYREAVFYLDTVNPKPEGYADLKECLERAEAELAERYKNQRFLADKAINLADWETAQTELKVLCEIIPDKDDDRHAEAVAKLVDVENRMKKSNGGKSK